VPDEDVPRLKKLGIDGVYGPGASTEDIVRDIRAAASKHAR
jgi:methylmalonyl-CoA mutase cobalamin-binding subunit